MRKKLLFLFLCCGMLACVRKTASETPDPKISEPEPFVIAFGSCNRQDKENVLWEAVLMNKPEVWIWGGDNIYSDTEDMQKMQQDYQQQREQKGYGDLERSVTVTGTWDDHDYGVNDGGTEYAKKKESQQLFLDFLKVPDDDERRSREGVYYARTFTAASGSVKVILLDTRYFRSPLTKATEGKGPYQPNAYGEGQLLGEQQWAWLQGELENSASDFTIIMSSIQVLSNQHGFETWGNFPHEVVRLKKLLNTTKAKGVVLLSGDRHISEFSVTGVEGLLYPVVDFTSSGLTHATTNYTGEPNPYRMGKVISQISFGLLKINFKEKKITMQMRGRDNELLQEYTQVYP